MPTKIEPGKLYRAAHCKKCRELVPLFAVADPNHPRTARSRRAKSDVADARHSIGRVNFDWRLPNHKGLSISARRPSNRVNRIELGSVLNKDFSAAAVVIQGFRIGGGLDEEATVLAERGGMATH